MARNTAENMVKNRIVLFLYGISALYLSLILIRYRAFEISDFLIFWDSGKSIIEGRSAYDLFYPGMPYLNGPLLSLMLAPIAKIPYRMAFDIWFILNVFLLGFVVKSIVQLLKISLSSKQMAVFVCLSVISYPIRHNLGIGSVIVLVLALILITRSNYKRKVSEWQSWLAAFSLVFAFELKPYLVIFFMFFLLIKRKLIFLAQSFSIVIALNVFYLIALYNSSWFNWAQAISNRSIGLSHDKTISSLYVLQINLFRLPSWFSLATYLASILFILLLSWRAVKFSSENYQIAISIIIGPILSLYSHPQDFVMIVTFALTFLAINQSRGRDLLVSLSIFSLFLNLGGNAKVQSFVVTLCLILVIHFAELGFSKLQLGLIILVNLLMQNIASFLLNEYDQGTQVQFLNLMCLISGYLCWWLILSNIKSMKNIHATSNN